MKKFLPQLLVLILLLSFASEVVGQTQDESVRFTGVVQEAVDVGYDETIQDGYPFFRVYSFGNNFVAVGSGCIANPSSGYKAGDSGLHLLDSQGNILDSRNVCNEDDGGRIGGEQGLNPSPYLHPAGPNRFVIPGAFGHPPRMYEIAGNNLRFISRAYDLDDYRQLDEDGELIIGSDAGVSSAVVGNFFFQQANRGRDRGMAVFSLPSFELIDFVREIGDAVPRPILGVGQFLILERTELERIGGGNRSVRYTDAYRVGIDGEISFAQTLGRFFVYSHARDVENPNRFALAVTDVAARYEGITDRPDTEFKIYTANSSGLSLETTSIKNEINNNSGLGVFALKGDMVAYMGTGADFRATVGKRDFQLVVEKAGELMEVGGFFEEDTRLGASGVAISSGGQILATADGGRALGLFSTGIASTIPGGVVPPGIVPNFPFDVGSFTPLNLDFFLGIARSYVNSVIDIVGGTPFSDSFSPTSPQSSVPSPSPAPSPFPGSTGSPQSPQSSGTTLGVVKDIEAIPNVSPTAYANLTGSDKCKGLFSGKNVREMGYDGGERVLWCVEYENITYQPGSEKAVILTDVQMLFPREECSTLGSRWEQVPGTEARTIGYCQRPLEISYASGTSGRQEVAFMFAVPLEKSSNPLNKIKEKIEDILGDILDSVDALENIIPEHSLINRHLDVVSALLGPLANESNKGVEEIYHHDKADILFLMVKPLYPFSSPSGSGSGNQALCSIPLTTETNIRNFQCQRGIVCSGTETTTGYGNLGPQTRAEWQETCGTDPLTPASGGGSAGGSGPIVPENQQDPFDDYQGDVGGVLGVNTAESRSFWSSVSESLGRIYRAGQSLILD